MKKRTLNFEPTAIELQKKVVDMNPESSSRRDTNKDDLVDFPYPADYKKGYFFIPHKLKATNNSISKMKREQRLNQLFGDADGTDFGMVTGEDNPFEKPISAILAGINSSAIRTPKVLGYTTKIKNEKKMKKRYIDDQSLQSIYPTFVVSPTQPNKNSAIDQIKQNIEESRKKLGIDHFTRKPDRKITYSITLNTKLDSPPKSRMGQSQSQKSLHTKNYASLTAGLENRHKVGSFAMNGAQNSNTSSIIIPNMHSRKPTKTSFGFGDEEKEIKEANAKIRNAVRGSMKQSMSCENLKKILLNQASYFHSPKAIPVAMESERAPILVLLDQDLMFIKDYMEDLRYSLKLVFEKVESYEYLIQKNNAEKQMDLIKKNQLLSYSCVFIFLKCEPFSSKTSSRIFNEMAKKTTCYLVKCSSGEKHEEVEGESEGLKLSQRSETMQHSLILGYNKFKTHFVPYEEYQSLQNFIVSKSKSFDESKRNSAVR